MAFVSTLLILVFLGNTNHFFTLPITLSYSLTAGNNGKVILAPTTDTNPTQYWLPSTFTLLILFLTLGINVNTQTFTFRPVSHPDQFMVLSTDNSISLQATDKPASFYYVDYSTLPSSGQYLDISTKWTEIHKEVYPGLNRYQVQSAGSEHYWVENQSQLCCIVRDSVELEGWKKVDVIKASAAIQSYQVVPDVRNTSML